MRALLKQRRNEAKLRPTIFYEPVKTRIIDEHELRLWGSEEFSWVNRNTPEDVEQARRRW